MKNDLNNYGIKNPDGLIRDRFGENSVPFANDGPRFVSETPLDRQREVVRQTEDFDPEKTRIKRPSADQPTASVSDLQSAADQSFAASSSTATASASASATASASAAAATAGTATGAAAAGTVAATAATGAVAVAGTVAATVATAVIVVAVFISTLAINLSLLLAGMTNLIFRVEMTGAQDEDFETPIIATITDGGDYYDEQEVFRDTLLLTFEGLQPGTEYTVTIKNEEKEFFKKTYVTATTTVERGFLSAWHEENEIFIIVEGVILFDNERFTVTAKDERGNVVFARDGVDEFAEYSFRLDARHNLYFTLLVGGKIAAATELRLLDEPIDPLYDLDAPTWSWSEDNRNASVSFPSFSGEEPLTVPAEVTENVVSPPTCETEGAVLYTARAFFADRDYIDERSATLPATGHDYQPDWEWVMNVDGWYSEDAATLYFTCSHDETHRYRAAAATVGEDRDRYIEATCEDPAESVYVATAEYEGKTYTDERPVVWEYSVLGHDFGDLWEQEPGEECFSYEYSALGEITGATMTLHCARCDRDVAMDAVEIELMTSGNSNLCEDGGEAEYYVFWSGVNLEYSRYPTATVQPLGHDYSDMGFDWTEENGAYVGANFVVTCKHDRNHSVKVEAQIASEEHEATCDDNACVVYTATAEYEGKTYTDTQTVTDYGSYLGHNYPDPNDDDEEDDTDGVVIEYRQNERGEITGAAMTLTCTRCGNSAIYAADEINLMENRQLNLCEDGGEAEYYVFWGSNGLEVVKYKTVTVEPLDHDYVDGDNFVWSEDGEGGYTANLILTCSRNPDHVETVAATVTKTEDATGVAYHAAAIFNGKTYEGNYVDPTGAGG